MAHVNGKEQGKQTFLSRSIVETGDSKQNVRLPGRSSVTGKSTVIDFTKQVKSYERCR